MSGVDNMNYMYSLNAANGPMRMIVDFDVKTDPNTDLILTQMRESQAASQLPVDVTNFGITVQKTLTAPLMLIGLYSPHGNLRRKVPGQLRLHQTSTTSSRACPASAASRFSARVSMRCGSGLSPTNWPSWVSPSLKSSAQFRRRTR